MDLVKILVLALLFLNSCSSYTKKDEVSNNLPNVGHCHPIDHLKCIYRTGLETIEDGSNAEWTRHWWRTSYIGKACIKDLGSVGGYILEGIFAIPHYIGVGIGNTIGYGVHIWAKMTSENPPKNNLDSG